MTVPTKWELVSRDLVYHKYSQTIERRDFLLPDGNTVDFYIRIEKRGVCGLAITAENKVITVPQFRPGPNKILGEIPGGQVDDSESPLVAMKRELLEETGYTGEFEEWSGTWQTYAYSQADRTFFVAKNCKLTAKQDLGEHEFGSVVLMPLDGFIAHARTGQITDTAGAMLALDHLGLLGKG